jgi:hypothetical protein
MLVVYSAKEGQAAVDGDGVHSPFAQAFVARLKKPNREVQRMFDDVRDDVLQATNERQEPYKYGSLPGSRNFFFGAGSLKSGQTTPPLRSSATAKRLWSSCCNATAGDKRRGGYGRPFFVGRRQPPSSWRPSAQRQQCQMSTPH